MTASDKLRQLVGEATPGPWSYREDDGMIQDLEQYHVVQVVGSPRHSQLAASGHLIALTPQLASLVADMADVFIKPEHLGLLARLDALFEKETA